MAVTLREYWNGTPERLWPARTLQKHTKTAVCAVWSHQFGWELRLGSGRELIRSQVVRSNHELSDVAASWREAMARRGWTAHST